MSNKKEKAAMTKATEKPALLPKLRFPEFLKTDGWRGEELEKLVTTVSPPVKLQTSSYLLQGKFPIIDQSQDTICGWTNDESTLITEPLPLIVFGDHTCTLKFVEKPFAQGADGIKILKSNPIISAAYLFQSLNHSPLVMEDYKRHFSILKKRVIYFPDVKTGEQQKIADCLGSIDELITLESQKLDALKRHKKGLMQQLFPAEGETVPRLRFPEFQSAENWIISGLGLLASFVNEKIAIAQISIENYIRTENILQDYGGVTRASNLPEAGSVTQFRPNDILFSNIRPYLKKVWYADRKGGVSNDVIVIRAKQGVEAKFLSFLIKNDTFISYVMTGAKGVKMPRGDIESMKKYLTPLPPRVEQQKIADCLTSLDDCITAQNQKISTLKTHKKGLMQQLFPTMGEV
ncbi:restriction endonuclease subunit S [Allofranklinella schreckenbergeri]|uniref:Restriction endonuclease subunit S n=1 Tax=Allofranklinella schreckenbergeri TaxID=1076744 RepID=A0A3M6R599_9BURK|nr:restriction endonuclease subunit S [Allofranklinella schreckenbergeri]RMX10417.1 restriction endonuclease subunit S [Allofranklinella schreckenbergeri]